MCDCKNLPETLADLDYWETGSGFDFKGAEEFKRFFQIEKLETEKLTPLFDYRESLYRCPECEQNWYLELLPEEELIPEFAVKLDSSKLPTDELIRSRKQFLSILAHDGFAPEICLKNDCPNFRLKGRSLCHLHLGF